MTHKKISEDPIYISILNYINNRDIIHHSELAKSYKISRQAIDYRLKKLEEEQLISRKYIHGRIYFTLTNRGKELVISTPKNIFTTAEKNIIFTRRYRYLAILFFTAIGLIGFTYYTFLQNDITRGLLSLMIWMIIGYFFIHYILNFRNKENKVIQNLSENSQHPTPP